MEKSQELLKRELLHYLSDTLLFLGCETGLVENIRKASETLLTEQLIDDVRNANIKLCENLKGRLANGNKMSIKT